MYDLLKQYPKYEALAADTEIMRCSVDEIYTTDRKQLLCCVINCLFKTDQGIGK